jgi:hypothetical protein
MGRSGSTSGKRQREVAKAAKAKAKRERRQQLRAEDVVAQPVEPAGQPTAVVLERLTDLHRRFEASEISFDDYDEAKAALLRQLNVE